ncbi:peroxidasin homolog [Seriola dumerili]|uniref:peroxidasin homolog n=1 Tax=Seriola dumerili TaxID=41447 RepID=UPI000BBEB7F3|nr:peroxidasin homolog [Seriola dumerili]
MAGALNLLLTGCLLQADPPSPTLTPSTLEVTEGTSVRLKCSAPAPCLSQPPTLTWTPRLGDSQETLQENQDKTKVVTSVLTFTASHLHHGKTISCAATYNKQDGSSSSSAGSVLTADISFPPQILHSSVCTKTVSQVNCSCETVGNPSPVLHWNLDGLPVDHSDKFAISDELLNDTGVRSVITVSQPQWGDLSTLVCHSSNSLGAASQRFCVTSFEQQTSAGSQGGPHSGVLPWAVAGVSLCVNVFCIIFMAFLWRARRNVKPKEEDTTYISLDRRDMSSEYDVIAQTRK